MDTAFIDFERVVTKDDKRVSFDKGNLKLAFESVSMCAIVSVGVVNCGK